MLYHYMFTLRVSDCGSYFLHNTSLILSGNWSGARDTVWELEGSTLYSLGTGGEHVMS